MNILQSVSKQFSLLTFVADVTLLNFYRAAATALMQSTVLQGLPVRLMNSVRCP